MTATTIRKYQALIDRIIHGITYRKSRGGTRAMLGKRTSADLRAEAGIAAIMVQVKRRQYQYIGHLARYPQDRLERQMLGAWLRPESEQTRIGKGKPRMSLREQYWQRIGEVMRHTAHHEDIRHEK